MNDTIVIGAGAAGLFAARELARAGKRVVVLESSQRVGGRMLTELETAAGVPIEMGAEFVHGDAPETTKLLDEARLATVRVSGRHFRSDTGQLSPQGPIWERMAKVFARMNADAEGRTVPSRSSSTGSRVARRCAPNASWREASCRDSTAPIRRASARGRWRRRANPTEGAAEARRIVNGYAALVVHLEREVAGLIRRDTPARRVDVDARGT